MLDKKFRETLKYNPNKVAQEILRVVLGDKDLVVLKCISQRDYSEAIFHGVILDCECILASGKIVNIEIQNLFYDDPFWRMSYNQSILRVENAPKKSVFWSQEQRRELRNYSTNLMLAPFRSRSFRFASCCMQ